MQGKTALFDWLDTTLDEQQDNLTIVLHIGGNAIDTETTVLQKEQDSQGRIYTVKRTYYGHLRIERKGRVLNPYRAGLAK